MRNWIKLLAAVAAALILTVFATTTPAPIPADAPAAGFSAARAMADVRAIAGAPRPTGSAQNARVRAYLADRLRALGMTVVEREGPLGSYATKRLARWSGRDASGVRAVNVIGVLEGRDPAKPALLLMAHHDSVWGSPGAADDAAGVAAILETARAIVADGRRPDRTLMILFTDAEELGLDGASAFFAQDPLRGRAGVIVNLEARGSGGRASMFETGRSSGAMMDLFARSVRLPVATSLSVFVYNNLPNSTDYTPAKNRGIPGFNFAFIGRPGLYHSPLATPDALDQGSLQDMGRQTLDLSRALLAAPELPGKAPDRVFYDLFGMLLLIYPAWAGWLILAAAVGAYAWAGWRVTGLRALGRGAGAALALFLGAAVLLFLGNLLSGADGPVNYYDRLAANARLEVQALLLCLGAAAIVAGLLFTRRDTVPLAPAFALPLLLLAAAGQAAAPTAAFPLQIALLLGGTGAAALRWRDGGAGGWTAAALAALGLGYMLVLGHALFQAMGSDMPYLMALPLVLGVVPLIPLLGRIERRQALLAGSAAIAAGLAIALWVRLDALAESVAVYSGMH
ncbi:M20/M25/M40 family metallo-hydrolase [Sphingomonas canadensis]|uniref:M20/M25/M40 family metallo-hydrolase n=1 Tax=Sphingomonas canadensis TaxID=1219257 RepID=A0ABW3H7R1_9SPHN|nr:M20/M25/M40 family metallo-hydrolase [Sphingomonas canadensis]MCW3836160.1 M20/M25/M40 family metallo-hydrolase [Sphingomonas canadensis]